MKKDNSAKSLPVKASKYPTKRTVNLAQRESHSRSTLTLTLGLVLIVVLSFCVANFGVLRQLDFPNCSVSGRSYKKNCIVI